MKITFLGTGTSQGVPVIGCDCVVCTSGDPRDQRLRTSIMVEHDQTRVVVDVGPDFRQQMLYQGVRQLDALLITHEHNDHIIGMDDVRPFNFRQKRAMTVYATAAVQSELRQRFAYIFSENPYPGAPRLQLNTINKDAPFQINDLHVIPLEVSHGKMPVLGFRFDDFTYITDAKSITAEEKAKIRGSRFLVLNALHHREHHSHFNLEQALELIEELQPEQAFLTHISHQMGKYEKVQPSLPDGVFLATDNLVVCP